jgi:hypothetical protein
MAKMTKWQPNTIPRSKKTDFIWSKTTGFKWLTANTTVKVRHPSPADPLINRPSTRFVC